MVGDAGVGWEGTYGVPRTCSWYPSPHVLFTRRLAYKSGKGGNSITGRGPIKEDGGGDKGARPDRGKREANGTISLVLLKANEKSIRSHPIKLIVDGVLLICREKKEIVRTHVQSGFSKARIPKICENRGDQGLHFGLGLEWEKVQFGAAVLSSSVTSRALAATVWTIRGWDAGFGWKSRSLPGLARWHDRPRSNGDVKAKRRRC